jgi:hypothetical protein
MKTRCIARKNVQRTNFQSYSSSFRFIDKDVIRGANNRAVKEMFVTSLVLMASYRYNLKSSGKDSAKSDCAFILISMDDVVEEGVLYILYWLLLQGSYGQLH